MSIDGWSAPGGDVHLRIWLRGMPFDYAANVAAARHVIDDWTRYRWCTIELIRSTLDDLRLLPRLPCERLFLGS